MGYKNFDIFLQAIQLVRDAGTDIGIVVAGEPVSGQEMQDILKKLPRNRVQHVSPTDEELAELYRWAEIFIFPSAAEGFGLPLLEAMSCGCPVIASNIDVFREVGASGISYADVGDPDAFADQIMHLLSDAAVRYDLVENGNTQASKFRWSNTANLTAAGYRNLVL